MTVGELIEKLQGYEENYKVHLESGDTCFDIDDIEQDYTSELLCVWLKERT